MDVSAMSIIKCEMFNMTNAIEDLNLYFNQQKGRVELLELADRLARKGGSHAKFLRHIKVYLKIRAPRFFWIEFDTYKFTEKQSQSTMHRILKEPITQDDFGFKIPDFTLSYLNELREKKDKVAIKSNLPESYMQIRGITTNYQSLGSMYRDRKNHELPHWKFFCEFLKNNLIKSEWITNEWD